MVSDFSAHINSRIATILKGLISESIDHLFTTSGVRTSRVVRIPTTLGHVDFKVVEAKISGGEHLGQHDDLAGVHREVFGDVEYGFEDVDVVALDLAGL